MVVLFASQVVNPTLPYPSVCMCQGVKRKREAMEAPPPALPPPAQTAKAAAQGGAQGVLARLDHLKCAVCLDFMVASHSVVPCGAPSVF